MANTYFKINKTVENSNYTNKYELTLTAFVGKDNHTQLTVRTESTLVGKSGISHIVFNDSDVDLLIAGLLERKLKTISATGGEQSIFSPIED